LKLIATSPAVAVAEGARITRGQDKPCAVCTINRSGDNPGLLLIWYRIIVKAVDLIIDMDSKIAKKLTGAIVKFNHPLFDFRSKEAKKNVAWVSKFVAPYVKSNCRLIDIGCGTGKQSFAAELLGAKVVGVDCSEPAIKYANKIKKQIGSRCQFFLEDYTKMTFGRNKFDVAIFPKNVIECSYGEIEKLSAEVKKILRRNAVFIVTMEDGLQKISNDKRQNFLKNIKILSGRIKERIVLPDKKGYEYPIYFWTVAFAINIFSKNFKLEKIKKIDSKHFMLVFRSK